MIPYLHHLLTLSNAATEGPWEIYPGPENKPGIDGKNGETIVLFGAINDDLGIKTGMKDAAFIAEARTAVPRLVEMVRVQQEALETIRGGLASTPNPKASEAVIEGIARRALARVEQLAKTLDDSRKD